MQKNELRMAIRAAFKKVPYPGDNNIGTPGNDDGEEVENRFRGKTWQSLASKRDLYNFGLYFMTAESCHYFLAAYLLVALKDVTGNALRGVQLRLKPYDGSHPYPKEVFSRLVSLLSSEQRVVLREFLHYAYDEMGNSYLKFQERREKEIISEWGLDAKEIELNRKFWSEMTRQSLAELRPVKEYWDGI